MGAWIEIQLTALHLMLQSSHPTMGAWIEILLQTLSFHCMNCRTPRWVRGLKYFSVCNSVIIIVSHPTMGAWIEILRNGLQD